MNVKAVVAGLVVAFVLFYVISSPDQAANIFHGTWNATVHIAHGIGKFVDKLAS